MTLLSKVSQWLGKPLDRNTKEEKSLKCEGEVKMLPKKLFVFRCVTFWLDVIFSLDGSDWVKGACFYDWQISSSLKIKRKGSQLFLMQYFVG